MGNVELVKVLCQSGCSTEIEGSSGKPLAVLPKSCPGKLQLQSLLVPKRVLSPTTPRLGALPASSNSSSTPIMPRLTDTMRRLGARAEGRDVVDILNQLLAEAEAAGPVSPRSNVSFGAGFASPRTSVQQSPGPNRISSLMSRPTSARVIVAETTIATLRVEPASAVGVPSGSLVLEESFEPYRLQFFSRAQQGYVSPALRVLVAASLTAKDGIVKCIAMSASGHGTNLGWKIIYSDFLFSLQLFTMQRKMLCLDVRDLTLQKR